MKKVIWVFGESATGKLTFINEVLANKNNIREYLGLNVEKIDVVNRTITPNLASFDDKVSEQERGQSILASIDSFANSNSTVLLIKGQSNDMDERYGNTLRECALRYPQLKMQIYLLEINDFDLHYSRFTNKDWFMADSERYGKMFTREWLPGAVDRHRKTVQSYSQLGYEIINVDSTNGFVLKEGDVPNNGESSNIRR